MTFFRHFPDKREALLAGQDMIGIRAYYRAWEQWADSSGEQALTDFTRHSLDELRTASATLD